MASPHFSLKLVSLKNNNEKRSFYYGEKFGVQIIQDTPLDNNWKVKNFKIYASVSLSDGTSQTILVADDFTGSYLTTTIFPPKGKTIRVSTAQYYSFTLETSIINGNDTSSITVEKSYNSYNVFSFENSVYVKKKNSFNNFIAVIQPTEVVITPHNNYGMNSLNLIEDCATIDIRYTFYFAISDDAPFNLGALSCDGYWTLGDISAAVSSDNIKIRSIDLRSGYVDFEVKGLGVKNWNNSTENIFYNTLEFCFKTSITPEGLKCHSINIPIDFQPYSVPEIRIISAFRSTSQGAKVDGGDYITVQLSGSYTKANIETCNTSSLIIQKRTSSQSDYEVLLEEVNTTRVANFYKTITFEAPDEEKYNIQVIFSDGLGKQISQTYSGCAKKHFMKWLKDNGGIIFNIPITFTKSILGKNGNGSFSLSYQNNLSKGINSSNVDDVYPHNSKFYFGDASSKYAIGMYDVANDRRVWGYNDVDNLIASGSRLSRTKITLTRNTTNCSEIDTSEAYYYPFLRMVVFRGAFKLQAARRTSSGIPMSVTGDSPQSILASFDTGFAPSSTVAASVMTSNGTAILDGGIHAWVRKEGQVAICAKDTSALTANSTVIITATWVVV